MFGQIFLSVLLPGCFAQDVSVFYAGVSPGSTCFRIPTLLELSSGLLLAFAEDRTPDCEDGSNHTIVCRRSNDGGATWGPVIAIVSGGPVSNPNPVETKDGKVLLHFETMNNPNQNRKGLDMQIASEDQGETWGKAAELVYPPLHNNGGLVGPSIGLASDGGVYYFTTRFEGRTNLYWGDGATWRSSKTSVGGVDECSIAFYTNQTSILANCRHSPYRRQILWTLEGDDYVPRGPVDLLDLPDPNCQGSIVKSLDGTRYFVSNNDNFTERRDLTVKTSYDDGESWNKTRLISANKTGYSQLATFRTDPNTLGLLFEGSHSDILFTNVTV